MIEFPKGKLVAIGGSVDKGTEPEEKYSQTNNINFFALGIIKRIIKETQKEQPKIEVITTASSIPVEVGTHYLEAFNKVGIADVNLLHIKNREESMLPENEARVQAADCILFTGGNQLRLSSIFGGTNILKILKQKYTEEEGFVLAGTSAGAMAMSNTMIYQGNSSEALLKGEVKITTGLGFVFDVIIDTHFVQRGRFGRLAQSIAANPGCMGIGLGEDTAVVISEGFKFEAIGSGLIILVDGHKVTHTNIMDLPEGSPISIENLIVHVMAAGDLFDLSERKFTARVMEMDEIPEK